MSAASRLEQRAAPLRVVTVGSSVAVLARPVVDGCAPPTWGRLLPGLLAERGIDAVVHQQGRWFEMVNEIWRRWDRDIGSLQPDVLVAQVGVVECQSWQAPHVVHRAALDWRTSSSAWSRRTRALLAPPLVRLLGVTTPVLARTPVGQRLHKLTPRRFADDARRLFKSTRQEHGAVIVAIGPHAAIGPDLTRLLPDMDRRSREYSAILRSVVEELDDPGARYVDAQDVVDRLGREQAIGDGLHLSAAGHAAIAEATADAIAAALAARAARDVGSAT